jgi:hypothetical protein
MNAHTLLRLISYLGLALSVLPSLFVFAGVLSMAANLQLMAVGTVLWFGTAVFWIKPSKTG